jgi:hypothetical protein
MFNSPLRAAKDTSVVAPLSDMPFRRNTNDKKGTNMKDGEHQFVLGDYVIYTRSHLEARQVYDQLMESGTAETTGILPTFTGKQIHWCKLSSQGTSASH